MPDDFARRLHAWYRKGYLAVDGFVFDIGIQTREVLSAIGRGVSVQQATRRDVGGNGNGALMRVLPLALWHRGTNAELVQDARASSEVTHGHVRSQLCCALYCLWARQLLQQSTNAWASAERALRAALPSSDHEAKDELQNVLVPELERKGTGTGYVVDTLRTACNLMASESNYEDVVKASVEIGNDTDTTAAVAGGLAGVRDGASAIPAGWKTALRGRDLMEPLLADLLTHPRSHQ